MSTPKTDTELADGLRAFVRDIMKRFDHPESLPMTPQEQADFIRWVGWRTKELRDSEPFLRGEAVEALGKVNALYAQNQPKSKTKKPS